jgi:hypothetical protein
VTSDWEETSDEEETSDGEDISDEEARLKIADEVRRGFCMLPLKHTIILKTKLSSCLYYK